MPGSRPPGSRQPGSRQLTIWSPPIDESCEALIEAITQTAPGIEMIAPGWCTLLVRGPARYFGGESDYARHLFELAAPFGRRIGIGVADGRSAATLAARRSWQIERTEPVIVDVGGSREFMAGHRLRHLAEIADLPLELLDVLLRLGLVTCGDLAALDRSRVLTRFGPVGRWAHELACGEDPRPVSPVIAPDAPVIERSFEPPVADLQPLIFTAKHLADELSEQLRHRGLVSRRIIVTAETDHGESSQRQWYYEAGFGAPDIVQRVRWQLEGWMNAATITAGVVLLRLAAEGLDAGRGVQIGLWGERSAADVDAARTMARLAGLFGPEAVQMPVWYGGRLVTERFGWKSTCEPVPVPVDTASVDPVLGARRWPGSLPRPAPMLIPDQTLPIELLDQQGETLAVNGRGELSAPPAVLGIDDHRRAVVQWAGPWTIDQRWWDPDRHRRLAHLQLVDIENDAYLVAIEHGRWQLMARYA
jgi:protein ImuB